MIAPEKPRALRPALRPIGAALCGLAVMILTVVAFQVVLVAFMPEAFRTADGAPRLPEPLLPYYLANLGVSTLAALAGGWIALRLAGTLPRTALTVLLGTVVVLNLLTLAGAPPEGGSPAWWTLGELCAAIAGIALAARLRSRGAPAKEAIHRAGCQTPAEPGG